jgi:hypothetical protein
MAEKAEQIDLSEWAEELAKEQAVVATTNARRMRRRGFLVFATDPSVNPDAPGYREVYATEAETPAKAVAKVRPLAEGRRLHAYLATGHYSDQLPEARWVA